MQYGVVEGSIMNDLLRKKIEKSFNEKFVGDVIFNDAELSSIYEETSQILRQAKNERGNTINLINYKLVFVALVNITKEWNSDSESFLDFIFKRLLGTDDGNGKVYNEICKIVNWLALRKNIYILGSFQKKYYATLISHAFAPISSTESFFDMCWEIYTKDLDYFYSKGDSVFPLISESLNKRFKNNSSDDDFTIGSAVYTFRAGIKGLAIDEKDILANLIERTVRDIDCLFNSTPINQDKYYETLVAKWWKKKEKLFGEERNRITTHSRIISDYSQIKAKYILNGANVLIEIPAFRLRDNIEYMPYLTLKINGEAVLTDQLDVKGSGILISTNKYLIKLSNYYKINDFSLERVEVEITHAGNVLYNSKKTLYRDIIIFKDTREIYSNECTPGQYYVFIPCFNAISKYPNEIQKVEQFFYSLNSSAGEVLQSNDRIIFFEKEKINREIVIHGQSIQSAKYIENGEEFFVVDGEMYVDILNDINELDYGVNYGGVKFRLNDFPFSQKEGYKRFEISTLLKVGEIGKINVFQYSTNNIVQSLNFIKFNNIRINYDKKIYYDDVNEGIVEFITEKYYEVSIFNLNDEEVNIKIGNGEIQVFPPKLGWKIDNNEYNYSSNRRFWWKELNNSSIINISIPKDMNIKLFLTNNNSFLERIGNENKFKIGQSIHALAYNSNLNDVMLVAQLDDGSQKLIANIYLKETFLESPIEVDSEIKRIHWNKQSFVGDNREFTIKILNKNNEISINPMTFKKDKSYIDLPMLADDYYEAQIVSSETKGFMPKEHIFYKEQIELGNKKNLKYLYKTICVRKAMYFDESSPSIIRPFYIDNIKYLTTRDGLDIYSGSLYLKGINGIKSYIEKMTGKEGQSVRINPVRLEFMNNISFYMGYGLDIRDPDFEYDGEFCINGEGKISIIRREKSDHNPDFYYIDEVK